MTALGRSRALGVLAVLVATVLGCASPAAPSSVPRSTAGGGIALAPEASAAASVPPAVAAPRATLRPSEPPSPSPSHPPGEPFAIDLYRKGDFVGQYTFEWCVGASIQMTLAMTDASDDLSRATQQRLWEMARDRSNSPFGGANPIGWVPVLNELGVGPYVLVSEPDIESAVVRAARAIVETGRPVGLVMWRGRHAWMMSGFESLGDPRERGDFRVTGVNVLDPLYPHGSRTWGPSPKPDSLLTLVELGRQFVPRVGGRIDLGVPPGYLLVLPILDEA